MSDVIPNATIIKKRGMKVCDFSKALIEEGFTDVILFGEDKKQPSRNFDSVLIF